MVFAAQPFHDLDPCVRAEVLEGRAGRPGAEVHAPAEQHLVDLDEQFVQRQAGGCSAADRLDPTHRGRQGLARGIGVDVAAAGTPLGADPSGGRSLIRRRVGSPAGRGRCAGARGCGGR